MLLTQTQPPWIVRIAAKPRDAYALSQALERQGVVARVVRGRKMETYQGLYNELAAALQFPDYFGENWGALDECLADLEWLPAQAYAILVTDADRVLAAEEPDAVAGFVTLLRDVAAAWAMPRGSESYSRVAPFHCVFQVDNASALGPALSHVVAVDTTSLATL
jgi:hypothetical protein